MRIILLYVFVMLFLSGCDNNSTTTTPLDFRTLLNTQSSAIVGQRFTVVKDIDAWKTLWAEHLGLATGVPMPEVNFAQDMVLGVFLGMRSNTCFSVSIETVEHIANQRVLVKFREQKAGPVCGQAETEPVHLIALRSSELPVEFVELE